MEQIMNMFSAIEKYARLFLKKYRSYGKNRELQLLDIIRTGMFGRMTLQEKIMTVARLVSIFEADFQTVPERLNRKLIKLNRELQQSIIKTLQ
jgi:hypothetical protein